MTTPTTIPEVITELDSIIEWSKANKSRIGYFACLYRRMTIEVGRAAFADRPRMERLAVNFANRYLSALEAWTANKPCCNAWCLAFKAANNPKLIVLQHLLLGVNTHINLDLAIAAAETSPGSSIHQLKTDFMLINDIIASLLDDVQALLEKLWFPLRFITRIANNRHIAVLEFSLDRAREAAWGNAVLLAVAGDKPTRPGYIEYMDNLTYSISRRIISPGFFINLLLWPVRLWEQKDVRTIIEILNK